VLLHHTGTLDAVTRAEKVVSPDKDLSRLLYYASVWRFKKGQHQIGLKTLSDNYLPKIRALKGYRGHLHLIDEKDPDTMVLVTMCDEEDEALNIKKKLFDKVSKELEEYFRIMPDITI
jgi:hypothetical protein